MKNFLIIALAASILGSCSTSNDVVSNGFLQKRKYTKGWHINSSPTKQKAGKGKTEIALVTPRKEENIKTVMLKTSNDEVKTIKNIETTASGDVVYSKTNNISNNTIVDNSFVSEEVYINENNSVILSVNSEEQIEIEDVETENVEENIVSIKESSKSNSLGGDVPVGLLYVLCFVIPWLAVGLATDWDIKQVIYNILWSLLCGIPGIIHALIVVKREN